jgi:hypothetical protein
MPGPSSSRVVGSAIRERRDGGVTRGDNETAEIHLKGRQEVLP